MVFQGPEGLPKLFTAVTDVSRDTPREVLPQKAKRKEQIAVKLKFYKIKTTVSVQ